MKKLALAAATALTMTAAPAMAQDYADDGTTMQSYAHLNDLNEEQRAERETWTIELRDYYDGLEAEERETWWYLDDMQRMMIVRMDDDAQMSQWSTYKAQYDNQYLRMRSGDVEYVRSAMVQDAPMPRSAHDGDYPVCESDADDHCVNAWAAGQRGPGVDRPLQYWPGES
ncbi:hypothetical protein [Aurantiacibacter sp. MUD61]|uniref:hypothetical protein n=1 Tax=Aurantiacibacter sp. MUD61 TaxID=3009083 RepID=UPI0022EFE09D|nr:hypothetical protein [Aurantiacibacter sp. MUD61]